MQTLILIPARMASARLPDKPLAMIGDAPMIVQVWRRAREADIGEVIVACDGAGIAEAIGSEGGRAVITHPDLPSGSDRIYAALQLIDPDRRCEVVVNLQGDMPTIKPELIRAVAALLDDPALDIATLAAPIDNERDINDPAVVKVGIRNLESGIKGEAECFSRQAQGKPPHYHHIGIYAYRRKALETFVSLPPSDNEKKEKLEQLRALDAGMRIGVGVVDAAPIGVDTPETLALAVEQMKNVNIRKGTMHEEDRNYF